MTAEEKEAFRDIWPTAKEAGVTIREMVGLIQCLSRDYPRSVFVSGEVIGRIKKEVNESQLQAERVQ